MSTIYLITSGAYSDYTVDAVCSTEEHAKRCVEEYERRYGERFPGCKADFQIETRELDEYVNEQRREWWIATIRIDSGSACITNHGFSYESETERGEIWVDGAHKTCVDRSYVSEEHALKLAAECRQAELAKLAGVL